MLILAPLKIKYQKGLIFSKDALYLARHQISLANVGQYFGIRYNALKILVSPSGVSKTGYSLIAFFKSQLFGCSRTLNVSRITLFWPSTEFVPASEYDPGLLLKPQRTSGTIQIPYLRDMAIPTNQSACHCSW